MISLNDAQDVDLNPREMHERGSENPGRYRGADSSRLRDLPILSPPWSLSDLFEDLVRS